MSSELHRPTWKESKGGPASGRKKEPAAMKKLSVFLQGCRNYLRGGCALNQLNSPSQLQEIVRKLPYKIREKWKTFAYDLVEKNGCVTFLNLSDFVSKQTNVMTLPVFADIKDVPAIKESKGQSAGSDQPGRKKLSLATGVQTCHAAQIPDQVVCLSCGKDNHDLSMCWSFSRKDEDEKVKFIVERGLCLGCLRQGHLSKGCRNRLKCDYCGRKIASNLSTVHRKNQPNAHPRKDGQEL